MSDFARRLLDLIAPRTCAVCGRRLAPTEQLVCANCNRELPRCDFAADPYEHEMARMFFGRLAVERVAAFAYYEPGGPLSRIISRFKYRGFDDEAVLMGRMMAAELLPTGFFNDIDMLVPTPLAPRRLRQRGYNQSERLACGIRDVTGLPVECRAVERTTFLSSQTHKDRWQRADNVEAAFRLRDGRRVAGKQVLLIDDVATTGATLCGCGRCLTAVEGVKLHILTVGFAKS